MMVLLLGFSPAAAGFLYVPPEPSGITIPKQEETATLGSALGKLAPAGLPLRLDRRVDPDRGIAGDWPDWQSLLTGERLASSRRGGEILVYPAGETAGHGTLLAATPLGWEVHPGETLREVLARWGEQTGVSILFLTDRDWRFHHRHVFRGGFPEAVSWLFCSLSGLSHAPAGEMMGDGATLMVRHHPAGSTSLCPSIATTSPETE